MGNLAPSPMPSHRGRGVAKGWGTWRPHLCPLPVGEGWPRMGNLAPSPMPSHRGRGVAKGWGVRSPAWFGCRLPRQASPATPSEKGNVPLKRGGQRMGNMAPLTSCPLIAGKGWPKDGVFGALTRCPSHSGKGVGCSLSPLGCRLPRQAFACHPFGEGEYGALTRALS